MDELGYSRVRSDKVMSQLITTGACSTIGMAVGLKGASPKKSIKLLWNCVAQDMGVQPYAESGSGIYAC